MFQQKIKDCPVIFLHCSKDFLIFIVYLGDLFTFLLFQICCFKTFSVLQERPVSKKLIKK